MKVARLPSNASASRKSAVDRLPSASENSCASVQPLLVQRPTRTQADFCTYQIYRWSLLGRWAGRRAARPTSTPSPPAGSPPCRAAPGTMSMWNADGSLKSQNTVRRHATVRADIFERASRAWDSWGRADHSMDACDPRSQSMGRPGRGYDILKVNAAPHNRCGCDGPSASPRAQSGPP